MNTTLSNTDVDALLERQELKARLAKLDKQLKPKIAAVCEKYGDGATLSRAGRTIQISRKEGTSTSWKSVATALASEEQILEIQPLYTLDRFTNKIEVL